MASHRIKLLAVCAILATAGAVNASAGTLDIAGAGIYSTNTLDVNGNNDYATALDLTVQGSSNPLFVFCVDVDHEIYVNIGSQLSYNPPLVYASSPVANDSTGSTSGTGNALSIMVSGEIQTLANLGASIARDGGAPTSWSANTQTELTAIQGAIWKIEYSSIDPSFTVTGTAAENLLIAQYVADAVAHPAGGYAAGIYPVGPDGQGFGASQGFAVSAPELSSWAMLLLGFGSLGVVGHYRRKTVAA